MTPLEIEEMAREAYNAVGDRFWSSSEIMRLIYKACMDIIISNVLVIENTYSTTTVASQKEYSKPSYAYAIKRLTYDGYRIHPMSWEEYESFTGNDLETTIEGTPSHYILWNDTLILYPTPNAAETLKIYTYNFPQTITSSSTLEVPEWTHVAIVDFVLAQMFAKEKEFGAMTKYYNDKWVEWKENFKTGEQLRKGRDAYSRVKLEEEMSQYFTGKVL